MKKILLASCVASLSAVTSANVFLPSIGIDGWESDSQFYRAAAFNQGYLTTSRVQNHTINPAFALDLMESAEARMDENGQFSGGVFTNLFRQNLGVYFGRQTFDGLLYEYDSNGNGDLDTSIIGDVDGDGNNDVPSNIIDAYWASDIEFGRIGTRINFRAIGYESNSDLQNDDTNVGTDGGLMELNTTIGFISNSMPLEATVTLGLPFGGLETVSEDTAANTKSEQTTEIDKGLRWGATAKYTMFGGGSDTALVSGFIGSANANYSIKDEFTTGTTTTTNSDVTHIQERFALGIVGSYERVVNNQTRMVASAGLTRISSKIGLLNKNPDPSQPNHDEYTFYMLPVALGVEFSKSEKTDFIGSVSSNLFSLAGNENYNNDGGDAAEENNETVTWSMPNSNVQFGMAYQMTPRLSTNFVINKALFSNGLNSGLTTTAAFTYDF